MGKFSAAILARPWSPLTKGLLSERWKPFGAHCTWSFIDAWGGENRGRPEPPRPGFLVNRSLTRSDESLHGWRSTRSPQMGLVSRIQREG